MGEEAAGGHVHVVPQVVGRGVRWPAIGGHYEVAAIEPTHLERQQFAHVPHYHRHPWELVEHSAVDQPEPVGAGRCRPSPSRPADHGLSMVLLDDLSGYQSRMKLKRYPKALQFGPDRLELRFIEVVPEDVAVVQNSLESELIHTPAQLSHGGFGILQWQGRESSKPVRVSGDRCGKVVVDLLGDCHGLDRVGDDFHSHRQREYLHGHAVRIHIRQADIRYVSQASGPIIKHVIPERNGVLVERRSHARNRECFFDSNYTKSGSGLSESGLSGSGLSIRNYFISDGSNTNGLNGFANEIAAA